VLRTSACGAALRMPGAGNHSGSIFFGPRALCLIKPIMQYWILFFGIVVHSAGFAQGMVLDSVHQRNVYVAIDNHIRFEPKNCTCADITVASDYGQVGPVYNYNDKCIFRYEPPNIGPGFVRMRFTVKGQVSDTVFTLLARPWRRHMAIIGNGQKVLMSKGEFLAHLGIQVPIAMGEIDGDIPILSYNVDIFYAAVERIDRFENRGGRFEKPVRERFDQLKSGDRVYFSGITVKMPGESNVTILNDISITIF
jgi:hypothetical protein